MTRSTLRLGSRGPDVKVWQNIIGVNADGIFGPKTRDATKAWQSRHGLTRDGIVGPKTWAASASAKSLVAAAPSIAPVVIVAETAVSPETLSKGSVGNTVVAVQKAIGATPTGNFDSATKRKVVEYQKANGLQSDGVVGLNTWSTLANSPAKGAKTVAEQETKTVAKVPSPVSLSLGNLVIKQQPTIRRGSKGEAVKKWQVIVEAVPDGVFGANTENLTRIFQQSKGLKADGVVGPLTWAAALDAEPAKTSTPLAAAGLLDPEALKKHYENAVADIKTWPKWKKVAAASIAVALGLLGLRR